MSDSEILTERSVEVTMSDTPRAGEIHLASPDVFGQHIGRGEDDGNTSTAHPGMDGSRFLGCSSRNTVGFTATVGRLDGSWKDYCALTGEVTPKSAEARVVSRQYTWYLPVFVP